MSLYVTDVSFGDTSTIMRPLNYEKTFIKRLQDGSDMAEAWQVASNR